MTECEDCGEQTKRRIKCHHCDLLVCSFCYSHIHCCEPSHSRKDCWNLEKGKHSEERGKHTLDKSSTVIKHGADDHRRSVPLLCPF
jgi:hypothetical protein